MPIDPRGMSVKEWTDAMAITLSDYSLPPRLDDPTDWKGWALVVCQSESISKFNPPNPYEFDDWAAWAQRFNQAVTLPT